MLPNLISITFWDIQEAKPKLSTTRIANRGIFNPHARKDWVRQGYASLAPSSKDWKRQGYEEPAPGKKDWKRQVTDRILRSRGHRGGPKVFAKMLEGVEGEEVLGWPPATCEF